MTLNTKCHYAECRYAEYHFFRVSQKGHIMLCVYAKCHYAKCRGASQ